MFKHFTTLVFFCLSYTFCIGQNDSLAVFRTNPNTNISNNPLSVGFKNAFMLSINHITRGGPMLIYQRVLRNPGRSVYAGYGVSYTDFVGQYTLDEGLELFPQEQYSKSTMERPGQMIDLGVKFWDALIWKQTYFCIGYAFISNHYTRKIDSDYSVANNRPRSYNLNYLSNEFKIEIGMTNNNTKRIYIDGSIGSGLRVISYQKLKITDDSFGLYNSNSIPEIGVNKERALNIKFWLFLGFKIGFRF